MCVCAHLLSATSGRAVRHDGLQARVEHAWVRVSGEWPRMGCECRGEGGAEIVESKERNFHWSGRAVEVGAGEAAIVPPSWSIVQNLNKKVRGETIFGLLRLLKKRRAGLRIRRRQCRSAAALTRVGPVERETNGQEAEAVPAPEAAPEAAIALSVPVPDRPCRQKKGRGREGQRHEAHAPANKKIGQKKNVCACVCARRRGGGGQK